MSLERMDDLFGVTELVKRMDDEEANSVRPHDEKRENDNMENIEIRETK